MAQNYKLKQRFFELEGPVGKPQLKLERVVGPEAISNASSMENKATQLENAKWDRRRAMIPRLSWTHRKRGKLARAREKLAGARWEDSSPKKVSPQKKLVGPGW